MINPAATQTKDDILVGAHETDYVIDTRPLCGGMQFVLTDAAGSRLVLKHGSHFLVMDHTASIPGCNTLGYGYYRYDTRHISQWEMTINDVSPSLLSASVEQGYAGSFLYTNPQSEALPQQKLMIKRDIVLADLLWDKYSLHNFHNETLTFQLKFKFQSDFADMFEVRGLNRPERGKHMVPVASDSNKSLFLAYRGLDSTLLETKIEFVDLIPSKIAARDAEVEFQVTLEPHQTKTLEFCITSQWDGKVPGNDAAKTSYSEARAAADSEFRDWNSRHAIISTDRQIFDLTVKSGFRDLYILRQSTPKGSGLCAGVPWYSALFGRDSAITAWQVLPFIPDLSKESIQVLAAYQGQVDDDYREEHPGRILHELRLGELARTNQIPHTPYYGTVDATPLWLCALCQYIDWSGDRDFAVQMWPAAQLALAWLDHSLEKGYLTYKRTSIDGLVNQGWKDSHDSVMFSSGRLADAPIALCEAQGYLYACWQQTSRLADLLGHFDIARQLASGADQLKHNFQRDFWMEEEQYIALGLDADHKQINVISSNPGHLLFTDILDAQKAKAVADRLLQPDVYSGWGVRTLSNTNIAYNPMGYHNGTVWPHDNGIIAHGMRRIGRVSDAHKIMHDLLEVSQWEPEFRLPELLCGFQRDGSPKPIEYPVSCSPQAWSAGTIFQLLSTCINFQADACHTTLRIVEPSFPDWLSKVIVRELKIGSALLDLAFYTNNGMTSCQVLNKSGPVRVIVES